MSSTGSHAPGGELPESPQDLLREIALLHPGPVKVLQQVLRERDTSVSLTSLDLEVESLRSADLSISPLRDDPIYYLVRIDEESVGPVELPIDWTPRIEYSITPTPDGCEVKIRSSQITPTKKIRVPASEVPEHTDTFRTKYFNNLQSILSELTDLPRANSGHAFRSLPEIQSAKKSAQAQRQRYRNRAERLLQKLRQIIAAWAAVGLHHTPTGAVPPSGQESILAPQSEFADDHAIESRISSSRQERRNSVAAKYSSYGLFVKDLRLLWSLICQRSLANHRMSEMADTVDIPEAITLPAAEATETLYAELEAVDKNIVGSQALVAVCEIAEASIVENREIPVMDDLDIRDPTTEDLRNARLLLLVTENTDADSFSSYARLGRFISEEINPKVLTKSERSDKSGHSIVKGGKRAAKSLRLCDYEESDEYGPDDLIRELRKADEKGEIPE